MTDRAFFVAGKFGAAQGIKGWVRVISFMENEDNLFDSGPWFIDKKAFFAASGSSSLEAVRGHDADQAQGSDLELVPIKPATWRDHSKGFAVALPGFSDRNQAQLLTHQLIYIPIENLEPLSGDRYYWRDLIGLSAVGLQGQSFGKVTELLETGANDVMVVVSEEYGRVLVPYIPDGVIKEIDLERKIIVLDWDFQESD